MPIMFKTGLDDTDFTRKLKGMEVKAGKAGKEISSALEGKAAHANISGGVRQYGDILDQISGQYGGVMKMNSAVHLLGLSLGVAFGGVGAIMLGERIAEDETKTKSLNRELDKLAKFDTGAAQSSVAELGKSISSVQEIKKGFMELRGNASGQSAPDRFGRQILNFAADLTDLFQAPPEGGHWESHEDKQKGAIKRAQKQQQEAVDEMVEKANSEKDIQNALINGDKVRAQVLTSQAQSEERIGELRRLSLETGVNTLRLAEAELSLEAKREKVIKGVTFEQQFKNSRASMAGEVRDNERAANVERETARKRQENIEKHLTARQQLAMLRNDINVNVKDGEGNETNLGRANKRARIVDDISKARDMAAQRAGMTPTERHHADAQERAMNRAANRAERRITVGMSKQEKEALHQQQTALKNATKPAIIDPASIKLLADAVKEAVKLLIVE